MPLAEIPSCHETLNCFLTSGMTCTDGIYWICFALGENVGVNLMPRSVVVNMQQVQRGVQIMQIACNTISRRNGGVRGNS